MAKNLVKFLSIGLVSAMIGISSCHGCATTSETPNVVVVIPSSSVSAAPVTTTPQPQPKNVEVLVDNWSYSLDDAAWAADTRDIDQTTVSSYSDGVLKVLLSKERYDYDFESYSLLIVRKLHSLDVNINESSYQNINGNPFVYIDSSNEKYRAYSWVTVKDNFGYIFVCRTETSVSLQDRCLSFAQTLKIN